MTRLAIFDLDGTLLNTIGDLAVSCNAVLALRGLVVYPEQTVHFDVGRTKSALALEAAMKKDQILLLVPQKDILVDEPKLADLCARFPGQVRPFDVDLSDRAKVDTFVQVLAASAPAPTHFIHLPALPVVNAKFKAFDQTRFDRDLEIQVHSAVRICRAVLPAMAKARFGRVLFIQTSYTIGCPPKNTAAYVMAKSAIGGLVKSLAVEYAKFGVTVNCVAPSMMETNFLKDTPDLIVQAAAEENPMGRNATPADVVPAMAFLLSDEAGFITGVTLPVTGGSAIV